MNTATQREAVAKLATYCERMIQRGKLPLLDEMNLRTFVNEACTAFNMAPVQDRLEQDLQIIREVMAS
jgi:hypothetical protein